MKKDTSRQYWQYISNDGAQLFDEFYHDYFRRFYNFGLRFTPETHLVEDSIQDVFVEIWNKRDKIPDIALPKAYFFAAFRNILLQKIRVHTRNAGDESFETEICVVDEAAMQQEADRQLTEQLSSAMLKLTPRQRQVIFLRFYEGLSYEEVAVIMNITVKATYKIAARSLLALKAAMPLARLMVMMLCLA